MPSRKDIVDALILIAIVLTSVAFIIVAVDRERGPHDDFADRSAAWLESELSVGILDRGFELGERQTMRSCMGSEAVAAQFDDGCDGIAYRERILFSDTIWRQLPRLEAGKADADARRAAFLILHEQLHRDDTSGGPIEEAATDAIAYDLLPDWSEAVIGRRFERPARVHYERHVLLLRLASEEATGADRDDPAAVSWRRELWASGDERRREMLGSFAEDLDALAP